MPRGINDVDQRVAILNSCVFSENGNAALTFNLVGVHGTNINLFTCFQRVRLLQHFINQSGLAMVNVSDDGDITQLAGHSVYLGRPKAAKKWWRMVTAFPLMGSYSSLFFLAFRW